MTVHSSYVYTPYMRIITSFGESEHESELEDSREFVQVFQALTHSLEVAENVFARVAKKSFRSKVGEVKFREAKDARGMIPTWVVESSLVLATPPQRDNLEWVEALDDLVGSLAMQVTMTVRNRPHVLVDSLGVRIQQVGEHIYKFAVKQKWALEKVHG